MSLLPFPAPPGASTFPGLRAEVRAFLAAELGPDFTAPERARQVQPSPRGELEIVSVLESYLDGGALTVERMGRGYAWLDTGTHGSLLDAGNFVRTLQDRQGTQVGCPEEIAFHAGWIDADRLHDHAATYGKSRYGRYLTDLLREPQG